MAAPLDNSIMARDTLTNTQRSPARTSPRKVLGELSPNKNISSPRGKDTRFGKVALGSPLKAQHALNRVSSPNSKKRSFGRMAGSNQDTMQQPAAKQTYRQQQPIVQLQSAPNSQTTMQALPRDEDSTDEDLDHLVAQPLMSFPDTIPTASQGQSQGGQSFSSLIDYDPDNATDGTISASVSPAVVMTESKRAQAQAQAKAQAQVQAQVLAQQLPEPPTEKILSRAETIRLRLRMAAYRVNTDQVHIPMTHLRVPRYLPTLSNPSPSTSFQALTQPARTASLPPPSSRTTSREVPTNLSIPSLSTAKPKATFNSVPKLLPAPTLEPSSLAPTSHKISYTIDPATIGAKTGNGLPKGARRIHEMFMVSSDLPVTGPMGKTMAKKGGGKAAA